MKGEKIIYENWRHWGKIMVGRKDVEDVLRLGSAGADLAQNSTTVFLAQVYFEENLHFQ